MQILGSSGLKNSLLASSFSSHLSHAGSSYIAINTQIQLARAEIMTWPHSFESLVTLGFYYRSRKHRGMGFQDPTGCPLAGIGCSVGAGRIWKGVQN